MALILSYIKTRIVVIHNSCLKSICNENDFYLKIRF